MKDNMTHGIQHSRLSKYGDIVINGKFDYSCLHKKSGVYAIFHAGKASKSSGSIGRIRCVYVGVSVDLSNRIQTHLYRKPKINIYLDAVMRVYPVKQFTVVIKFTPKEELGDMESVWINRFNPFLNFSTARYKAR